MVLSLDHVIVAVADLDAAATAYAALLGRAESWRGSHPQLGTTNVLFRLENCYVELLAARAGQMPLAEAVRESLGGRDERPFGLALGVHDLEAAVATARRAGLQLSAVREYVGVDERTGRERRWRSVFLTAESVRGLRLLLIEHLSPPDALPMAAPRTAATCDRVDHVVVFTADLPAAAAMWVERFGLRESWQRDFPERQTRNRGLDLGGVTLELITRTDRPGKPAGDKLWGLAYEVRSCDAAVDRVRAARVPVDDPRTGLLPGSRVATVRWNRTPTLLIER